ncbi:YcbK family protein [Rhodovulum sp. DZ06]|uniref:YcbK family protein n=1 Tax=Rhodovulum sp. DZ06 TaxID=3425126 RepID=UPI003D328C06
MTDLLEASHWREVDLSSWPWPDFSPAEMASKGDGSLKLSRRSMDRLQRLRDRLGVPLVVLSAYRDPAHNRRVGGAKRSQHLEGKAFDIRVDNIDPERLIDLAREEGFTAFGTYPAQGFVHIDDRARPARWGAPFPRRGTRFAPEPVPRPAAQAAKEGVAVEAVIFSAERAVQDAAPALPGAWVTWAFAALGIASLGVVLWRAFGRGREQ